jgi:adenosylcobyric acid synthase
MAETVLTLPCEAPNTFRGDPGLFERGEARAAILGDLGGDSSRLDHATVIDQSLDAIADALAQYLDIDAFARIAAP